MTNRKQFSENETFAIWSDEVDRLMKSEYAITIDDAGIDRTQLYKHWKTWAEAREFVAWFASKYDLTGLVEWKSHFRATC